MRIHQVSMTGFGPFRHAQTVDLDGFADDGIFLISGRTGAGKSSVLDAIVYALYDSAPRYGTASGKQLRSDHCTPDEPSRVELVFSAGSERYRVVRTPEYLRPKSRGEGFTPEKATAELSRWDGDHWVGVASQLRTVGEALHEIVPLSADQFLQVVLLAQGQFQRFLVASSEERQKVLRTLFRSDRFGRYDEFAQRRAADLRQQLQLADAGVEAMVETLATHAGDEVPESGIDAWLVEVLQSHDADVEVAAADLEQARKELAGAESVLAAATALADRQRRVTRARSALAALTEQQPQIDLDRTRRDRGLAAASCVPAHRALVAATAEQQAASSALALAVERFDDVVGTGPPDDLAALRDDLGARVATLQSHLADEQRLEHLRATAATLSETLAQITRRGETLRTEREQHARVLATEVTVTVDKAEATLVALRDEAARSTRREKTVADLLVAEVAQLEFGRARTAASTALDRLRERRLAEYAGTLAQQLRIGEPCAVCGGTEHPAPAAASDEPVTEAMEQTAEQVLADAEDRAGEAGRRVASLRATIEGLGEVRPADELADLVDRAAATVRSAQRAEAERARAVTAMATIDTDLQRAEVRRAALEAEQVGTADRVVALSATVEAARADADSVADRLAVLLREKKVTDDLVSAATKGAQTDTRLGAARETLDDLLAHHGFATDAEFVAARIDAATLEQWSVRIRRHDDAFVAATSALAEPELQDLPDEPVDVAAPRATRDDAMLRCDAAVGRHASAGTRATYSHELADAIRAGWARTAEKRAEYDVLNRLARSLHGDSPNTRRMRLESYVLGAELTQIVTAANTRLRAMSTGRYELQRSSREATKGNNSGLEVEVLDHHTGETRAPESLSGGEKFLASLALALGLAEVVTSRAGGITLDTLFIDEGFGSLDAETLDIAMHTLDGLREHGRTVGVISHVETMKERIPQQFVVETTAGGWSDVTARR